MSDGFHLGQKLLPGAAFLSAGSLLFQSVKLGLTCCGQSLFLFHRMGMHMGGLLDPLWRPWPSELVSKPSQKSMAAIFLFRRVISKVGTLLEEFFGRTVILSPADSIFHDSLVFRARLFRDSLGAVYSRKGSQRKDSEFLSKSFFRCGGLCRIEEDQIKFRRGLLLSWCLPGGYWKSCSNRRRCLRMDWTYCLVEGKGIWWMNWAALVEAAPCRQRRTCPLPAL